MIAASTSSSVLYVHCSDVDRVARALESELAGENMRPLDGNVRALFRAQTLEVRLFPGARGWTLVKTDPIEILCDRAPRGRRPRMVELARALGRSAFFLGLYGGESAVLLEASPEGRMALSGRTRDADDPLRFHDERIEEQRADARFSMVPVAEELKSVFASGAVYAAQRIAKLLAGSSYLRQRPWDPGEVSSSLLRFVRVG